VGRAGEIPQACSKQQLCSSINIFLWLKIERPSTFRYRPCPICYRTALHFFQHCPAQSNQLVSQPTKESKRWPHPKSTSSPSSLRTRTSFRSSRNSSKASPPKSRKTSPASWPTKRMWRRKRTAAAQLCLLRSEWIRKPNFFAGITQTTMRQGPTPWNGRANRW
jgi:hypothetical protein